MKPKLRQLFEELIGLGHEARREKIVELGLSDEDGRRLEAFLLFDDMKDSSPANCSGQIAELDLADCVAARLKSMLRQNVIPPATQETIARAIRRLQARLSTKQE